MARTCLSTALEGGFGILAAGLLCAPVALVGAVGPDPFLVAETLREGRVGADLVPLVGKVGRATL